MALPEAPTQLSKPATRRWTPSLIRSQCPPATDLDMDRHVKVRLSTNQHPSKPSISLEFMLAFHIYASSACSSASPPLCGRLTNHVQTSHNRVEARRNSETSRTSRRGPTFWLTPFPTRVMQGDLLINDRQVRVADCSHHHLLSPSAMV